MGGNLSQSDRVAEFTTPLGKDALVLIEFTSTEGLGELFEYHVEALGEEENIDFDKAIGQSCTLKLKADDGKTRIYNGIMTEAQWIGALDDYFRYRLVLRPWFWLLDHKADCRIFLDKNVKDIIQDVFNKAGFSDFDFRTTGSYDKIEYCVQYRETDFAFVCRLMEQYGIYYFFEPSDDKHTMVLADSRSSHKPIPDLPNVEVNPLAEARQDEKQMLNHWVSERCFRTGKVQFNDYDYLQPKKDLKAPKEGSEKYTHSKLEVYDYPGKYDEKSKGEKFAQFRLEAEQALDHRRATTGDAVSLYPGGLVTVEKHPTGSENKEYLIVHGAHHFSSLHYRSGQGNTGQTYDSAYQFQPSDRPFRSLPLTPQPRIYGIQTAKVVTKKGEDGEEISTDEHGRIWVKFFWDREPQKTCPIRVAQVWASKQWGGQFIPRIDMEVVVEFLEGDPDRPLVTGCVFNGDNKYPYKLPDNKTQSGLKSDSSKGHGGYNELMFEDKKGAELVRFHAEKDLESVIEHDEKRKIGNDQTLTVGSNQTETIEESRSVTVMMNDSLTVAMNQVVKVGAAQSVLAGTLITLTCGASSITISPSTIIITSPSIVLNGPTAMSGPGTIGPPPTAVPIT